MVNPASRQDNVRDKTIKSLKEKNMCLYKALSERDRVWSPMARVYSQPHQNPRWQHREAL